MLQAYISNRNQHLKRFDKQKLISAAVLLGNAALSLDWVEGLRKICLLERVPRRLFIQSSSSCATLTRSTLLIKCSKKLHFSKEPRLFGVALFWLNVIGCFSKERQGAYFCPTYIEGRVLSKIHGLDTLCRFYYICGQFVLHLSALLHLWSIITFVASTPPPLTPQIKAPLQLYLN